jgi:hypothetical protein
MLSGLRTKMRTVTGQEKENDGSAENLFLSPSNSNEENGNYQWHREAVRSQRYCLWTILNCFMFLVSISIFGRQIYQRHMEGTQLNYWLKKTSYFCKFATSIPRPRFWLTYAAPVLDRVEIPTFVRETDGGLYDVRNFTPYRNYMRPDRKVDEAWISLDTIRTFPLTAEDVMKLGKDPTITVKYPEEYGLGPDAYVGQLDVFHQLHCLNLLRELAWAEYGRNETHGKKPFSDLHWLHVSHCTDLLLQNIQCTGNMDVLTFNWLEGELWPWPNFYVNHQCRDFDAIVKWQDENALPLMMGRNLTRPPGVVEIQPSETARKFQNLWKQQHHIGNI